MVILRHTLINSESIKGQDAQTTLIALGVPANQIPGGAPGRIAMFREYMGLD